MYARRAVLKTLAGMPLAAALADSASASAAVKITTKAGKTVSGALALPSVTPAPVVILVHEWWGLNDEIKTMAVALAEQGFVALAIDLFGGRIAANPDEAKALVGGVVPDEAGDAVASWIDWGRNHPQGNGKVGTLGWCFGGGWSLNGSTLSPVDATVVYYGKCDLPTERLSRLKGPVMGHFGTADPYINKEMVGRFESAMNEAGKPFQVFWYEAGHAFANPTGQNFHKDDAQFAWSRTLEFLGAKLKS